MVSTATPFRKKTVTVYIHLTGPSPPIFRTVDITVCGSDVLLCSACLNEVNVLYIESTSVHTIKSKAQLDAAWSADFSMSPIQCIPTTQMYSGPFQDAGGLTALGVTAISLDSANGLRINLNAHVLGQTTFYLVGRLHLQSISWKFTARECSKLPVTPASATSKELNKNWNSGDGTIEQSEMQSWYGAQIMDCPITRSLWADSGGSLSWSDSRVTYQADKITYSTTSTYVVTVYLKSAI